MKILPGTRVLAISCTLIVAAVGLSMLRADAGGDASVSAVAPSAPAVPWLNVKDFGAKGDGEADDAAALQKAFDAAGYDDLNDGKAVVPGTVLLPPGHYRVTKTLELGPRHRHLVIVGSGGVSHNLPRPFGEKPGRCAAVTQIVWDGPEGGHLFNVWSVIGLEIRNVALIGHKAGGNRAGVLLRVNSQKGRASSQFQLNKVAFLHAQKGIEFGGESYINSDCSTFIDCGFYGLEVGIHARSEQNVGYLMLRPGFGKCKTAVWFEKGGIVDIITPLTHHIDVFLRIDQGGINGGTYRVTNLHMEQNSCSDRDKRGTVLIANGETTVEFSALQANTCGLFGAKADFETPNFILGSSASVLVRASHICGKIAVLKGKPDAVPTWITFENCRFRCASNPKKDIDCDEFSGYRFRDCSVVVDDTTQEKYKVIDRFFLPDMARFPKVAKGQPGFSGE